MKRKAYSKSILREIKSSKARFISILVIILLGVAFYSGIKASGPNMKAAIENFSAAMIRHISDIIRVHLHNNTIE